MSIVEALISGKRWTWSYA